MSGALIATLEERLDAILRVLRDAADETLELVAEPAFTVEIKKEEHASEGLGPIACSPVLAPQDESIDDPPTGDILNDRPCGWLADHIDADRATLIQDTARNIETATAFLIEAPLVEIVREDVALIERWPWSETTAAGVMLAALRHWSGNPPPSRIPDFRRQPVLHPDAVEWFKGKQRRLDVDDRPKSRDSFARALLSGAPAIYVFEGRDSDGQPNRAYAEMRGVQRGAITDAHVAQISRAHDGPVLKGDDDSTLCVAWQPGDERATRIHPDALGLLFESERRAKDTTLRDHAAAAAFARRVVHGFAHDPTYARALNETIRSVLELEVKDAAFAKEKRAKHALLANVSAHLRELADALGEPLDATGEAPALEGGLLAWDARFATFLERWGDEGARFATAVRKKSEERAAASSPVATTWLLWTDLVRSTPIASRFVATLAQTAWRGEVRARVELELRKPAALVRPVHAAAIQFHSRVSRFDADSKTLTFEGRELARMMPTAASFDLDVILRGLSLLGSVDAHRLFRWEVITGHERALRNEAYANVLDIEGGWTALAKTLGLNPDKAVPNLRAIVKAQAHFEFSFPDGARGNMLSYTERDARGRDGRARVTITLGTPLLPGYEASVSRQGDKKLVPLLRELPPLYGRANEHGEQLTMSLALMAEFRERSRELAEKGAVQISHARFTQLADQSGLPRKLIVPVVDLWTRGDTRSPPFLSLVAPERYTLAEAHGAERTFLEEGGRRELAGAHAGTKSAAKRLAKLKRIGAPRKS